MKTGDRCEALLCAHGKAQWAPGEIVAVTAAKGRYTTPWRERYTVRTDDGVEHPRLADVRPAECSTKPPRRKAAKRAEVAA